MTARRYLYLLGIIWLMLAGGMGIGAAQTADDSSALPTPATPGNSTVSTTTHKTSHHKKKKSTTATTSAAKSGVAKTSTAKAGTAKAGTAKAGMAKTAAGSTPTAGTTGATPATGSTVAAAKAAAKKKTATAKNSSKKKNKSKVAKTTAKPTAPSGKTSTAPVVSLPTSAPVYSSTVAPSDTTATAPMTVTKSEGDAQTQITISAPPLESHPANGPEVDTGLPVARHNALASEFPISPALSTLGTYVPSTRVKSPPDNFVFTNFNHRARNTYPWKIDIYTTIFWIGEGATTVSSTDNIQSAWDTDWRSNNGGTDSPYDREGYMPANHAARMNPFYVALPFNDLAFPDKARRWLPSGWYRPPKDGKQVSACKDRWVEIKNAQGEICYAQWEDVGPLRYDHAEYVFGDERPDTLTHAGLDVSPAVADYLNVNGKNCITRWRFVDDADVQPGMWLKYDEEALIYKAMHDIKEDPTRILPIQRATAPIDDENDNDANKKRMNAAKG